VKLKGPRTTAASESYGNQKAENIAEVLNPYKDAGNEGPAVNFLYGSQCVEDIPNPISRFEHAGNQRMREDFPEFHDPPEESRQEEVEDDGDIQEVEDDGDIQESVGFVRRLTEARVELQVLTARLTEARAELYRRSAKRIRNSRFHGDHLCKRHGPDAIIRGGQEGPLTRGCGAHNGRCTIKSRGGPCPRNHPAAVKTGTTTSAEVRRR
jgi:hypothetical protein